ncbi:ParB N-terminal domain-containing protein [Rhizobium wenxiniae]|uniref:MT-A70 family methyltransferase n=1 Tax=Rhizobium wenxiniae TaxID=1737357 RepID=UPI001C6E32C0|nr:MT-A70 family methyltransferase [Rhizobium wenxiniae]MBW9090853.1 ParB N-terminal domain-containing protein [Rhizobium wenxiniae]
MSNSHQTAGERAQEVIAALREHGSFTCADDGFFRVCMRMHQKGMLDRDIKNGKVFTFSAKGSQMHGAVEAAAKAGERGGFNDKRHVFRRKIDTIEVGERLRPVDQARVVSIMASIRELGLKTPITVFGTVLDAHVRLSAGGHRLEAMRQLGHAYIDCFHENGDDLDAELWEIDENLARSELTPADRALFTHRRKEIYLLKNPETAQHVSGGKAKSGAASDKLSFAEATAQVTGQSRKTIERDAARGSKIDDMALHMIRGSRLNSGAFLDRLKQVPIKNQVLYVKAALDDEKRKAAEVKENRQELSKIRHAVRLTHMAHVATAGEAKAGQVAHKFSIIYADPPWKFGVYSEVTGRDKSPENHYPTMSTDDICGLFEKIGTPAKADAVLFLWATNPMLLDALKVMDAWGFSYVHHWIWDKEVAGTGYWGRDRHELLLIGKRGSPLAPLPGTQPHTVHSEAKGRHSAKPEFYADTIDRLYPGVPKLEMFSRSARPGWTAWGFEAGTQQETAEELECAGSEVGP